MKNITKHIHESLVQGKANKLHINYFGIIKRMLNNGISKLTRIDDESPVFWSGLKDKKTLAFYDGYAKVTYEDKNPKDFPKIKTLKEIHDIINTIDFTDFAIGGPFNPKHSKKIEEIFRKHANHINNIHIPVKYDEDGTDLVLANCINKQHLLEIFNEFDEIKG